MQTSNRDEALAELLTGLLLTVADLLDQPWVSALVGGVTVVCWAVRTERRRRSSAPSDEHPPEAVPRRPSDPTS